MSVFDYINGINNKNYNYDPENAKDYNVYIINKAFSLSPDTVTFAAEADRLQLRGKEHYDFLYFLVSKKKRYNEWPKIEKIEDIDLISEYYNISILKAKEYLNILTEDDLVQLRLKMDKGGKA